VWLGAATMGCVMPARMFSKAQPSCASRRQQITARAAVITSVPVVGPGPLSLSAGKATRSGPAHAPGVGPYRSPLRRSCKLKWCVGRSWLRFS
jgi:hypothetical protein